MKHPSAVVAASFAVLAILACEATAQIIIGPRDGGTGGVVIGQPVIPAPVPSAPPPRRWDDGRGWDRDGGRNGYDGRRRDHEVPIVRELTDRDAVRIARISGLREVESVVRTRGVYRVEGFDGNGDEIEVVVDRRDGRVLSVR